MNLSSGFIVLLTLVILLVSGCTSDTKYEQPQLATDTSIPQTTQEPTPTNTQNNTEPEPPTPILQTFSIGETATDGELNITLNSVRFVDVIENDNQFLEVEASEGKEFVILDITVENLKSDETQRISTLLSTEVFDGEGYTYNEDFSASVALEKGFIGGEILPGKKKRGELVFEVPKDVAELQFAFKFDVFTGTTALFDLK